MRIAGILRGITLIAAWLPDEKEPTLKNFAKVVRELEQRQTRSV
jgi:hypothetical protein